MTTDYRPSQPLQDVLGFTREDLSANRAGYLGKQQADRLWRSARPFWRLITIVGVFALLMVALLIAFSGGSREAGPLYLLVMLVPGGLCAIFFVRLAGIYASVGDGRVTAAEGLAEPYTKHAYRGGVAYYVRIGSEEFFIDRDLQMAFKPGSAYRVFYTPKGRILVAGEFAAAPDPATIASRLVSPELASALGFSREDLDANRAGRQSAAQVTRLRRLRKREMVQGLVSAGIAAGIIAAWPLFDTSTISRLFWGGILLLPAALALAFLWSAMQRHRDLQSAAVRTASGPLERVTDDLSSTRRRPTFSLRVEGVRLPVPLAVYGAFADGGHYALYHTPHSRLLLSAEPLDASR
jgi:hypothetical protein